MLRSRRRFVLGATLALVPARARAARELGGGTGGSLAGQLLVAAPDMGDPRFAQTVILIVQHGAEGAMGLVVNHPVGDQPIADLLRAIGEPPGNAKGSLTLFSGGPLEPTTALVVHSSEYRRATTRVIDDHLSVSSPKQVLPDIGAGHGPRKRLLIFGYADWAPGQLEAELSLKSWVTEPETPELVFDVDRAKAWDVALARQTVPL